MGAQGSRDAARHHGRAAGRACGPGAAEVGLRADFGERSGTAFDLFLEATREDVSLKRGVFRGIAPLLAAQAPLATTSSSILPGEIHPRCLGAHCFFPLEITRLVEVVIPGGTGRPEAQTLLEILRGVGLQTIVQAESNLGFFAILYGDVTGNWQ